MFKTLVIVESPGKIATISKYLGNQYIVRASYGHLFDLAKDKLSIDIDNNFVQKYELMDDKKDKLAAIMDAASSCNLILAAQDGDREGTGIAKHIADALKSTGKPIKRVIFSEITKKGIEKGIANQGEIDENLFQAQCARRSIDRLVGYLVSPFVIKTVAPNTSAGRVQSCAIKIIRDREAEIESFKAEEYWNISATLSKDSKEKFVAKYNNKIKMQDKKTADKIKSDLDVAQYKIDVLEEEERKKNPLPPFITSSLASTAAGKFKFKTDRIMKTAQSLYEAGLITYMRVDSYRISEDALEQCREWLKNKAYDVPEKPNVYIKSGAAQDAHEAIRPTSVDREEIYASDDEKKIYKLIRDRFICSQMNPAIYDTVSVTIKTSNNHILKANGRVLKYKGWIELTGEDEDDKEEVNKLPIIKKNDDLILVAPKVKAEQKFTQPPARFSEKTLIKELERRGIGRPSTYAAIMSTITSRNYVIEKTGMFHATDLGKKVIDSLVKFFDFVNYEYTAGMELKLDKVAEGKLTYLEMMNDFYTPFAAQLKKAYLSNVKDYGFKCYLCKESMELKNGRFGLYMACVNHPSCKNTFSCELVDGKPVRKTTGTSPFISDPNVKCPKCNKAMIKRDGKFGPFYACYDFNCKGTRKVPFGKKCIKCGDELYINLLGNDYKLCCMGYAKGCKYVEDVPTEAKANLKDPEFFKAKPKLDKPLEKIIAKEKIKAANKPK